MSETKYHAELDAKLVLLEGQVLDLEQKCIAIEGVLKDASKTCQVNIKNDDHDDCMQKRLHEMIRQRRDAPKVGSKEIVKEVSKSIQKELRAVRRAKRTARINNVLTEFKDLRRLLDIRNNGRRTCMSSVMDKDGVEKVDKGDMAEVFAAFFETLYDGDETGVVHQSANDTVDEVAPKEIRSLLKHMKGGKAADEHGIVVEYLRNGSDLLIELIANMSLHF